MADAEAAAQQQAQVAQQQAQVAQQQAQAAQQAAQQQAQAAEALEKFNRTMRNLPKFSHGQKESFRSHELAYKTWFRCNQMERFTPHLQKLSLLMSLTGSATKANELYGPENPTYGPEEPGQEGFVTFDVFFQRIKSVFMPRSESNLSRLEFESAKQGAQEPPGDYCLRKLAMYSATEPNPAMRSFQYLRSNILKGLYSSVVRSRVVDLNPTTDAELLNAVLRASGEAKEKYMLHCEDVTTLDGLASTTQFSSNANNIGYSGRNHNMMDTVEDMEIDRLEDKDLICHFCKKKGHRKKDCYKRKNQTEGKKGEKDKDKKKKIKCYNCGLMGHYKSECRKPKQGFRVKKLGEESDAEADDLEELVGQVWEEEPRRADFHNRGPQARSRRLPRN